MTEAYYGSNNPYAQVAAPRYRFRPQPTKQQKSGIGKEQLIKELSKMVARADRYETREINARPDDADAFMYWSGYKAALYDLINTIEGGTQTEDYQALVVDATDWPQLEQLVEYACHSNMTVELAARMLVNKAVAQ